MLLAEPAADIDFDEVEKFADMFAASIPDAIIAANGGGKEDVSKTLIQYIGQDQQRLLAPEVLATLAMFRHSLRHLFTSYLTDDVLTGEPPPWSEITREQLQLQRHDAMICCCALQICPDLVAERELDKTLEVISPSGNLLFPQFLHLLWNCALKSETQTPNTGGEKTGGNKSKRKSIGI